MGKPLAIKILDITKPKKPEGIYIIDGKQTLLEGLIAFYSTIKPGDEPLTTKKGKLSFERIVRTLDEKNIPYQKIFTLDDNLLQRVETALHCYIYNLPSFTVALLFAIEFENELIMPDSEEESIAPSHKVLGNFNFYVSRSKVETPAIDPEFLKSILLSASQINFYHLQLLSLFYDTVWDKVLQIQDFASLFTREEAIQIFEKVFVPKPCEDEAIITPGWMRLLCMAKEADVVYNKFLDKVKEIIINTFYLQKIDTDLDAHGCEKILQRLLCEKKPEVFIISNSKSYRFPSSIACSALLRKKLETANDFTLMMILSVLMGCIEGFHKSLQEQGCSTSPSKITQLDIRQETFEFFLIKLKTLIKNYFSSSPFMVLLFYSIPYMILDDSPHKRKEKLGKIFFHHFNDFLLSIPDKLLRKQRFKKVIRVDDLILVMLLSTKLDATLMETLVEKCLKIENFPLEIFLFHPEIRKCKTYEKLVLKVAKSERRVVGYIETLETVKNKRKFSNLHLPLQDYELIYSDIKKNISISVVKKLLQRKYVINGIEDKMKILAVSSEEDRINFKRHLILKEVGLHRGDLPDVLNVVLNTCKVYSLYDLIKFTREISKQTDDNEFEVFARMLSEFAEVTNRYISVSTKSSEWFLKNVNVDHVISVLRKVIKKQSS